MARGWESKSVEAQTDEADPFEAPIRKMYPILKRWN